MEYRGEISKPRPFRCLGNNHHSIIEFKGKWYLFYHTENLCQQWGLPMVTGVPIDKLNLVKMNHQTGLWDQQGSRAGIGSLNPIK